ncbi:MAG: tetratricopeptide repeat protein [Myxococcales bacterium]|nr:tetratricopeptide repeat protein [Myxococcales bacterium]
MSVVAAAALGMSPSLVLAQGTARTQAQQIFSRGEQAFANKQYADALKAFEEAYLLDPVPVLLYNIGRAHEELRQFDEAGRFFQRYLDRVPDASDRKQVEQRLALLRSAARAQSDADSARAEAERAKADAEKARADAAKVVDAPPPTEARAATTVGESQLGSWILVVGGGVLALGGGALLAVASSKASDAEGLRPDRPGLDRYKALESDASLYETLGWSGIGLGVAAAGAGVTLLLLRDEPLPGGTRLGVGPGGLVLGGTF